MTHLIIVTTVIITIGITQVRIIMVVTVPVPLAEVLVDADVLVPDLEDLLDVVLAKTGGDSKTKSIIKTFAIAYLFYIFRYYVFMQMILLF